MREPGKRPDWQTLNAYVDGELDVAHHASVAAAIAADGDLAHQVAALARLRAATAEAFAADVSEGVVPALPEPPRRGRRWAAIAAAALIGVAISLVGWHMYEAAEEPALAAHRKWATRPVDPFATASRRVGIAVPDLADAGLQVALVKAVGEAFHIGYLGNRGCRVSLWAAPDGKAAARSEDRRGDTLIARWSGGGYRYWAIASGMPAVRFAVIAASLERATIEQRSPDEATRIALRSGRDQSLPCLG